jgi:hypothetical protein
LIGVNVLGHEPKKLNEVMEKEQVTWRSISSQAVTSRWNAGTPTYYIIDVKGVIRYKRAGPPSEKVLDAALDKMIKAAEGEGKDSPRHRASPGPPATRS